MNDINGTTDETDDYLGTTTDGYHDTSAPAYQMGLDQDLNTDEYWLHYNTTDVYHSGQNVTTEYHKTTDEITSSEISILHFVLLISKCILAPLVLTGNSFTIIVVSKYIIKITPTHVVISFLAFSDMFVGVIPLVYLAVYLARDLVLFKYINLMMFWVISVARSLNIYAVALIAVERFFLLTSWKMHQYYLTVKKPSGPVHSVWHLLFYFWINFRYNARFGPQIWIFVSIY